MCGGMNKFPKIRGEINHMESRTLYYASRDLIAMCRVRSARHEIDRFKG